MAEIDYVTVQIAAGQSLSGEVDIGSKSLVGIVFPSNWTTASLSFQASIDSSAFGELLDQTATAISVSSVTGGALTVIAIDPAKLRGITALKVRSGTSGVAVNQVNLVTLTLITRLSI